MGQRQSLHAGDGAATVSTGRRWGSASLYMQEMGQLKSLQTGDGAAPVSTGRRWGSASLYRQEMGQRQSLQPLGEIYIIIYSSYCDLFIIIIFVFLLFFSCCHLKCYWNLIPNKDDANKRVTTSSDVVAVLRGHTPYALCFFHYK